MTDSQGEPEVWWFNTKTARVEYGRKTNSADRVGPFATEAEASRAIEILGERAKAWRTQEEDEG